MTCPDNPWLLAATLVLGLCTGAIIALWWAHFSRERPLLMQLRMERAMRRSECGRPPADIWDHIRG
jgi:hypothetical protein